MNYEGLFFIFIGILLLCTSIRTLRMTPERRRFFQTKVSEKYITAFMRREGTACIVRDVVLILCGAGMLIWPQKEMAFWLAAIVCIVVEIIVMVVLRRCYFKKV